MQALSKLVNLLSGPGRPPPSMSVEGIKATIKEPPVLANVAQTPIKVRALSNFPETLVPLSSVFPGVAKINDPKIANNELGRISEQRKITARSLTFHLAKYKFTKFRCELPSKNGHAEAQY